MTTENNPSASQVMGAFAALVDALSRRVKQLGRASRPLVESLEKHSPEDLSPPREFRARSVAGIFSGAAPTTP